MLSAVGLTIFLFPLLRKLATPYPYKVPLLCAHSSRTYATCSHEYGALQPFVHVAVIATTGIRHSHEKKSTQGSEEVSHPPLEPRHHHLNALQPLRGWSSGAALLTVLRAPELFSSIQRSGTGARGSAAAAVIGHRFRLTVSAPSWCVGY